MRMRVRVGEVEKCLKLAARTVVMMRMRQQSYHNIGCIIQFHSSDLVFDA